MGMIFVYYLDLFLQMRLKFASVSNILFMCVCTLEYNRGSWSGKSDLLFRSDHSLRVDQY